MASCSPHLVVLSQGHIDDRAKRLRVAYGGSSLERRRRVRVL